MTIEEIKKSKKAWDAMQLKSREEMENMRKQIYSKYGFKNTWVEAGTPEETIYLILNELEEAEKSLKEKYPFYIDLVECMEGADIFYQFLLASHNVKED